MKSLKGSKRSWSICFLLFEVSWLKSVCKINLKKNVNGFNLACPIEAVYGCWKKYSDKSSLSPGLDSTRREYIGEKRMVLPFFKSQIRLSEVFFFGGRGVYYPFFICVFLDLSFNLWVRVFLHHNVMYFKKGLKWLFSLSFLNKNQN